MGKIKDKLHRIPQLPDIAGLLDPIEIIKSLLPYRFKGIIYVQKIGDKEHLCIGFELPEKKENEKI